jgi:hypothetical protein
MVHCGRGAAVISCSEIRHQGHPVEKERNAHDNDCMCHFRVIDGFLTSSLDCSQILAGFAWEFCLL